MSVYSTKSSSGSVTSTVSWQYSGDGVYSPQNPTSTSIRRTFSFTLPSDAKNISGIFTCNTGNISCPNGYTLSRSSMPSLHAGSNTVTGTFTFKAKKPSPVSSGSKPSAVKSSMTLYPGIWVKFTSESGGSGKKNPGSGGRRSRDSDGVTITEYENNCDYTTDAGAYRSCITIYDAKSEQWVTNGLGILRPDSCDVTEVAGGDWSLEMTHPIDDEGRWKLLQYDRVIRCAVPLKQSPALAIERRGQTDYHKIYKAKIALKIRNSSGKVISKLVKGEEFEFLRYNKNKSRMWMCSRKGVVGWINPNVNYTKYVRYEQTIHEQKNGEQYTSATQPVQLRNQCFRIYEVSTDAIAGTVSIKARHISYDFCANLIKGSWKPSNILVTKWIQNLMGDDDEKVASKLIVDEKGRTVDTDMLNTYISGDYSYMNPVNAIMDPEKGVVAKTQCQLIRDNTDFFLCDNTTPPDRGYIISYGKNLQGLRWTVNTEDVVTVIMPTGQTKSGKVLKLPELYVQSDHVNDYPFVRVARMEVSEAKVGGQETDEDTGKVIDKNLSESEVYAMLRKAAKKQFADGADLPTLEVEIDFTQLETTEEYKDLAYLYQLYLYDTVHIRHEKLGYTCDAQVMEYTFDAIAGKYKSIKLGDIFKQTSPSIGGYQLSAGSVSGTKIAVGSIDATQLSDASITNAKIAYGAIQSAHIEDAAITTAKIQDAAITNAKISDLNAEKITAGTLSAERVSVSESIEFGGESLVNKINTLARNQIEQYVADPDAHPINPAKVIGYVANDAVTVTDQGLVISSQGSINVNAGGVFTVDSSNLKVDKEGSVEMHGATVDGAIMSNGHQVLTQQDIDVNDTDHMTRGSVMIVPRDYEGRDAVFTGSAENDVDISGNGTTVLLNYAGTQPTPSPYKYALSLPVRVDLDEGSLTCSGSVSVGIGGSTTNATRTAKKWDEFTLSSSDEGWGIKQLTWDIALQDGVELIEQRISINASRLNGANGKCYLSSTSNKTTSALKSWYGGSASYTFNSLSQRSVYVKFYAPTQAGVCRCRFTNAKITITVSINHAPPQTFTKSIDISNSGTQVITLNAGSISEFITNSSSGGIMSTWVSPSATVTGGRVTLLTQKIKMIVTPEQQTPQWVPCNAYYLSADSPDGLALPTDVHSSMVELWSGEQALNGTFTLNESASSFRSLMFVPVSSYGSCMIVPVGAERFSVATAASNSARMYFMQGTATWNTDMTQVTMAFTLRFYKTSATAGSSSTAAYETVAIYGMR